ncbi:uncharacterized protein LOC102801532 [Saccoglossus kowalevskii]|uniref:Acyl-CoA-binding domain-containing protein 4-like n=1 Tax=Saccoglossus kowalevskii TaxID=10224 RepID=A0ABM0MHY4_SACKO|nr:PREDICTED: acyl-CoA-binding domain-containing protein 4-like [Saccoglossus kowalevskii]
MSLTCTQVSIGEAAPSPRTNHASIWYENKFVVYGGNSVSKYECLDDLWVLDTTAMTWTRPQTSGSAPGPRCHHTMTLVGNKAFLFGGWTGKRRCNFLHSLDIDSWTWDDLTAKMSAVDPHSSHAATPIDANTLLTVGRGETGTHAKYGCNIDFLNIKTLQWTTYPGSTISRAGHSLNFQPDVSTRYAVVFGGRQRHMTEQVVCKAKGTLPKSFHSKVSDEVTKNSRKVEVPPGRSYHSSTDLSGLLLIYGGFIEGKSVRGLVDGVTDAFLYDVKNNRWLVPEKKGEWPPRAGHTAARIGDRSVMLFGGEHAKHYYNDVHVISW